MKGKKNWKIVLLVTAVLISLTCSQVSAAVLSVQGTTLPTVTLNNAEKSYYTDADGNKVALTANDVVMTSNANYQNLSAEDVQTYLDALDKLDADYQTKMIDYIQNSLGDPSVTGVVVKEIFDVNLSDDIAEQAFANGGKLALTFEGTYQADDAVVITVYNKETGEWDIIPEEDLTINDDGSLTVLFSHLCPVAFVVPETDSTTASSTVKTSDKDAAPVIATEESGSSINSSMLMVILGVGILALVAAVVLFKKNKKA